MLASTVQFSTYDQTPVTRPRRPHNPAGRGGTRNRPALPEATVARSLRTQQRAYEPDPSPPHAFHTPKGRTSGDDDSRPNWSAFHPRAPPQKPAAPHKRGTVMSWARLWTTSTRKAASAP
jgi:hypothetical protein